MRLYKCDLTIYVLAEDEQNAQLIAAGNAEQEHYTNWEVEQTTEEISGEWGVSLPYSKWDDNIKNLTCNELLERNKNE